jgi:hypothetical protein
MGEIVRLKEPKPLVRAAGSSAPVIQQEETGEYDGDNVSESEIERARRLPLSPAKPRS